MKGAAQDSDFAVVYFHFIPVHERKLSTELKFKLGSEIKPFVP
jgi:hypothetical protein